MIETYGMETHKLYWHLDRVNDLMKGKRIVPLHIDLGITTRCNLRCSFCYGILMKETNTCNHDMSKKTLFNLYKDCKNVGVKSIALTGEGENTLNSCFYESLDYANEIGLDIGLATNGVSIDHTKLRGMMEALTYLRFNISAGTREIYKVVHGKDFFNRVVGNIKKCVETKQEYNLKTTIGLQMVVVNNNFNDILPLAKLGKKLGVDYLVVKPCSDAPSGILKTPHKKYTTLDKICREAEKLSTSKYSVIIKWDKMGNEGIMPYNVCRGTTFMISINSSGDVAPCGHLQTKKWKEEYNMGNINKTRFKDIVKSDKYWNIQNKVKTCINVNRDCETNCKQYSINQFLEMLSNKPKHINFP